MCFIKLLIKKHFYSNSNALTMCFQLFFLILEILYRLRSMMAHGLACRITWVKCLAFPILKKYLQIAHLSNFDLRPCKIVVSQGSRQGT